MFIPAEGGPCAFVVSVKTVHNFDLSHFGMKPVFLRKPVRQFEEHLLSGVVRKIYLFL